MSTEEAANYLNYSKNHVCWLCKNEGFPGVRRFGKRTWMIPKQSVIDYEPGLRGFAHEAAKKRAEAEAKLKEQNEAIRKAKGQSPEPVKKRAALMKEYPDFVTVEQAAEILGRSKRTVRSYCFSRRIAGARKMDKRGKGWIIPKASLDNVLPGVGIISETGQVLPLGRAKDAEV